MTDDLASLVAGRLGRIDGIAAVVLGGSRVRGTDRPDSDVDLGLYYREAAPFAIDAVRALAKDLNDSPHPVVTDFSAWGPWVNGGAWLTVGGQRLDFVYRNVDKVERTIDECRAGRFESDFFLQQPPYGFHSYVYLGEVSVCVPLHDPDGVLADLKRRLGPYPEALKRAVVGRFLWAAEFTVEQGRKTAGRGDVYNSLGALARAGSFLVQVLYALNEKYFVHDKGALEEIERFGRRPDGFSRTLTECVMVPDPGGLPEAADRVAALADEVASLCEGLYERPDFRAGR